MPRWFRRLSGILTISGGAAGAAFTIAQVAGSQVSGRATLFSIIFLCIFAARIFIGTLLLENNRKIVALVIVLGLWKYRHAAR